MSESFVSQLSSELEGVGIYLQQQWLQVLVSHYISRVHFGPFNPQREADKSKLSAFVYETALVSDLHDIGRPKLPSDIAALHNQVRFCPSGGGV